MKLNSANVAGLKEPPPGKTDAIIFDDDLPGFGLRLRAGGRRTWIAQYRFEGLTRRVTVGNAAVMTVAEARKAARIVLAKAATGDDPQGERRRKRDQAKVTLRSLIGDYLSARSGKLRSRTMIEINRYLTGSYFRALHAMPIEQIGRKDVAAQVMRIERESGGPTATAARSKLSALFVWAVRSGLVENNPLIGCYAPDAGKPRDRVLSSEELVRIWRACRDDDFGRIVRLLILLGQRRGEVGGMRWSELDIDRGLWTLPSDRTKNHRVHTLPLPAAALAIVNQVPHRHDRDQLFGDRAGIGFSIWHHAKRDFDKRLGSIDPWGLHDIRRSVATGMADLGVLPHTIESLLNHYSGHRAGVASTYNRSSYEREVRAALALWADHIRALVNGGERTVLAFPQR